MNRTRVASPHGRWLAFLFAVLLALAGGPVTAQPQTPPVPQVSVGRIERLASFPSRFVDARHVDVWLPEGYTAAKRYPVVYLHDGQMLFDATHTWNHQSWALHETAAALAQKGLIPGVILVGVWNNGKWRHSEYMPEAYLAGMPAPARERLLKEHLNGKAQSDAYLRFLVEELKPAIDAKYATRPEREATFVMGSSMGGLISVYALARYPEVFGGAAGLSTHWVGIFQPNAAIPLAGLQWLRTHLPPAGSHRLYQDHGDQELDAMYGRYQPLVDDVVHEAGWRDGVDYQSLVFPGTGHTETAWSQRAGVPLAFLLGGVGRP